MTQRVVISFSTIPSRINGILPTLQRIHNQSVKPDAIYLGIPKRSFKENRDYYFPAEYTNLCTPVWLDKDYGPVCKILGALVKETDPNTIIITIDDDVLYPPRMIEALLLRSREHPDAAIGSSGLRIGSFPFYISFIRNQGNLCNNWYNFTLPDNGKKVDILAGYSAALYKRSFFPKDINHLTQYAMKSRNIFLNDDVLLSSWLSSKGIPRLVHRMPEIKHGVNKTNGLSDNGPRFMWTMYRAIIECEDLGLLRERYDVKYNQTVTFPFVIGGILLLAFIVLYSIIKLWKQSSQM